MSSALLEEGGGVIDAASDEVLLTNGATEADEGEAEYLEEHDPMAPATKRVGKPRRPVPSEEVDEENVEALDAEAEEMLEEADDEEEGKAITRNSTLRKPSQLPKKRKTKEIEDDDKPTSTARAAVKLENQVDENQCRVCTSKETLVSLFKTINNQTIAEKLMVICPTVSIALKDFMPQFICNTCLDNVNIALELKSQCETTERELRKKLSRSKNKVRRPAGYVVIDAVLESEPSDYEPNDDVEFKVSDQGDITAEEDSDDSDFGSTKKKRTTRSGGAGKRGKRKSTVAPTPPQRVNKKKRGTKTHLKRPSPSPVFLKEEDESSDALEEQPIKRQAKKKKLKTSPESDNEKEEKNTEYPCDECDQVFSRKLSLLVHKKAHTRKDPIKCEQCGQVFKIQGAYRNHLQKHREEPTGFECSKCEYMGSSKAELRRHLVDEHDEQGILHECEKCNRKFVSEARLQKHKDGHCPGQERPLKARQDMESFTVGKDLFKSVAPLTTTYWSDSFSD